MKIVVVLYRILIYAGPKPKRFIVINYSIDLISNQFCDTVSDLSMRIDISEIVRTVDVRKIQYCTVTVVIVY